MARLPSRSRKTVLRRTAWFYLVDLCFFPRQPLLFLDALLHSRRRPRGIDLHDSFDFPEAAFDIPSIGRDCDLLNSCDMPQHKGISTVYGHTHGRICILLRRARHPRYVARVSFEVEETRFQHWMPLEKSTRRRTGRDLSEGLDLMTVRSPRWPMAERSGSGGQ